MPLFFPQPFWQFATLSYVSEKNKTIGDEKRSQCRNFSDEIHREDGIFGIDTFRFSCFFSSSKQCMRFETILNESLNKFWGQNQKEGGPAAFKGIKSLVLTQSNGSQSILYSPCYVFPASRHRTST